MLECGLLAHATCGMAIASSLQGQGWTPGGACKVEPTPGVTMLQLVAAGVTMLQRLSLLSDRVSIVPATVPGQS